MKKIYKRINKTQHNCLLKKGKNTIYIWNGCGYKLQTITTNATHLSIDELAYICVKSNKGDFVTMTHALESVEELLQNDFITDIDGMYFENECYAYCDMGLYGLENGFLLIENMRTENVEVHS